jgi:hypothetical protein
MRKRGVGKGAFEITYNPGPASYNLSKITDAKAPQYTMGKKRSMSDDEDIDLPGPGSYDVPIGS